MCEMNDPAAHAAQAPALREQRGINRNIYNRPKGREINKSQAY